MITQKQVKELFNYDPETGILTRKIKTSNRAKIGEPCGFNNGSGYLIVSVFGRHERVHRIAYLYFYGLLPDRIDHINGVRTDNRATNLRACTNQQNLYNSKKRTNNTSGIKGVSWNKDCKMWDAYLRVDGKIKKLGLFWDIETASQAVRIERVKHHGEFANHG